MDSLNKGIAPLMQEQYVKHDLQGIHLKQDRFRVVWFEEGDAAALLYGEEIIAVIPGWSGKGFHGYAKRILNYMATQTALPWREIGFLAEGHTIPCNAIQGYTQVRLLKKEYGPKFKDVFGEIVNLLWLELEA